jgi:hypothetical protein
MAEQFIKPKQRIPKSEKTKEWGENCGRYYRDTCFPAVDKAEAMKLYRLANGELDEKEYLYVTNPINTTKHELMGYPARIKNYDIISPNVMLLMGEKAKRNFPPVVYAKNYNHQLTQTELYRKGLVSNLQKQFINESLAFGVPLEEEQITQTLQQIDQQVKSLPDEVATQGQDALEYIIDYNDLPRLFRKGFYDWVCQAMVYSYRDVIKGRTYYESISPLHLSYLCPPHKDFIEEGEAVKVSHRLPINEIYDRFQDDPLFKENKDLVDYLDSISSPGDSLISSSYEYGLSDIFTQQSELFRNVFGRSPEQNHSSDFDVDHIMWRSSAKLGKVKERDLFGNEQIIYVDEDYVPFEGEDVEWEWVDEIWETYCIADKFYIGTRPIPIQRGEYNRPQKAKLLYNGRNFFARHTRPTSIVKKGEPYQKSVNIVKYRAEESLLKSLDKIILFPLGMIPKKEGWNEEKLMYYVRAFSFLFFDDTRPNASAMVQAMKELNISMGEHILRSFELVASIKAEYDEVCGINRQRKAQINSSDGKATSEYALSQSYVMSEEFFLEFEEFERREYECMIELSKFAFHDGISSQFIKTNGQKGFLNIIDPSTYCNADLGVFVRNGAQELEKLNMMKAQVQPFVQNGASGKAITGLIESNNFADIHKIMDEMDAKLEARFQQEQETQKEIQASMERVADKQLEQKYYSDELASYTDIQVALIDEGIAVADRLNKLTSTTDVDSNEVQAARNELEKNAIELMKNSTKLKEIAAKERMNKDNNKTKLQNKVVGE